MDEHIIQVGTPLPGWKGKQNARTYRYKHVEFDDFSFADAGKYLPRPFDLCDLLLGDGEMIPGWHAKTKWDGFKLTEKDVVIKWRKVKEDNV